MQKNFAFGQYFHPVAGYCRRFAGVKGDGGQKDQRGNRKQRQPADPEGGLSRYFKKFRHFIFLSKIFIFLIFNRFFIFS